MKIKEKLMEARWIADSYSRCIKKRQSRLQELEAERDQLSRELDALELAIKVLREDFGEDEWGAMCAVGSPPSNPYGGVNTIDDEDIPITHKARNAAYVVLSETRPIHRSKLLEGIKAQGVEIFGPKPENLLSAYLSPDGRFTPYPGLRGCWTLTEEPTGERRIAAQVS